MYSVIIVEDDPVIINLNTVFLGDCSSFYLKGVFRTADEALGQLTQSPADLVLLDLHLPGMNGIEFMEAIRSLKLRVQVIVLTMDNDVDALRELYGYGILDYLIKPYSRDRFIEAMNCFLQKAHIFNGSGYVTQQELDTTYAKHRPVNSSYQKGIQQDTRERFIAYLESKGQVPLTIDELVNGMSLSRVTIRRYMSYFKDLGLVTANINYSTGGRPSMIYIYNNESASPTRL